MTRVIVGLVTLVLDVVRELDGTVTTPQPESITTIVLAVLEIDTGTLLGTEATLPAPRREDGTAADALGTMEVVRGGVDGAVEAGIGQFFLEWILAVELVASTF